MLQLNKKKKKETVLTLKNRPLKTEDRQLKNS